MKKQTTSVSHNNAVYELEIGRWLQHLHSDALEACREIATEDILLPNGQKAGIYKVEKRTEYDAQPDRSCSSSKKYLNSCSQRDFMLEWDELLSQLKQKINNQCIPLLWAKHKLSETEQCEILKAASNGHVGAMCWIGTAFRDIKDDNCLLWLSMAHNRGHVGACYEMAAHLASKGNHIESLRCLIISADGGCDHAYMTIFNFDVLTDMFKIEPVSLLDMLDEFEANHSSSARFFKGMLMLFQGKKSEGLAVLEAFSQGPKKQPTKDHIDSVYENQIKVVSSFVQGVLADIASGIEPLDAIPARSKQAGFISFEDFDEALTALKNMQISR